MGPDQDSVSLDVLLTLVKDVCTKEMVQDLLRRAKKRRIEDTIIRISGDFETVVFTHLRDAIQTRAIQAAEVHDLVRQAEESGKQHIFYFQPKGEIERICNAPRTIAAKLLGPDWESARGFPKFYNDSSEMKWSDFRIEPTEDPERSGWVAKLYAGVMRPKHVETRREGPHRFVEVYEEHLAREIHLIRWHHFGLLELRVPLERRLKSLIENVQGLWDILKGADIGSEDFEPIGFTKASRRLIERHAEHAELYRLGDVHLLDSSGGTTRVSPRSGDEDVMREDSRRKAIELFERCRMLVVVWLLSRGSHDTDEELRVAIGKIRPNEVTIVPRTTEKAITHVTHQLRRFSI